MVGSNVPDEPQTSQRLLPDILSRSVTLSFITQRYRGSPEQALNAKLTAGSQVTLHQGAIEAIFLDSLRLMGRTVERPIKPTSIELSQNEAELRDPRAYPVKVRHSDVRTRRRARLR